MRITRANYEVYFVDYFDGRLSEEAKEELMRFLEAHPDLKEEFYNFDENVALQADSDATFPKKEALKKQETAKTKPDAENWEAWFIAYAEGDLNNEEQQQSNRFLQENPSLRKEFLLYQKLSLKADPEIRYPGKRKLRKNQRKRTRFIRYASFAAAAAVVLLAGVFWFIRQEVPDRTEENISRLSHYEAGTIDINQGPAEQPPKLMREEAEKAIAKPLSSKDRNQPESITQLEPLAAGPLSFDNRAPKKIAPRYEQASEYYYQTVLDDLEYLVALKKYEEKTLPGKMLYRIKNTIAPPEDYYIINHGFSPLNLLGISSKSLEELATSTLPEKITIKTDNRNTKKYAIKSGIFEITHKRTRKENQ
ncbi:MAG: hypothetical protein K9I47_12350 [Bacteroidales bacterium]|nr:hypothetical protein [Bacteroidales bacterium]